MRFGSSDSGVSNISSTSTNSSVEVPSLLGWYINPDSCSSTSQYRTQSRLSESRYPSIVLAILLEKMKNETYFNNRKPSTATAYINEPIDATMDDRNWSLKYLRDRLTGLVDLFKSYKTRLHHSMLMVYLFFQIIMSIANLILIITLNMDGVNDYIYPEIIGHSCTFLICLLLILIVSDEIAFRSYPHIHLIVTLIIVVTLCTVNSVISIYFIQDTNLSNRLQYGNVIQLLIVTYTLLPFNLWWQIVLTSTFITIIHIIVACFIYINDSSTDVVKLVIEIVVVITVNIVGIYYRYIAEIAFHRAFLDKKGSILSKVKHEIAKQQEETLLLSIIPKSIMQQVKKDFRAFMDEMERSNGLHRIKKTNFQDLYVTRHEPVSILYADIVNFTPLTTKMDVNQLVEMLNDLFGRFDNAGENNNCLRIKLLGDCYYCVSGLPEKSEDHANNCVNMGLDMIDIIREVREDRELDVDMRIGIHTGSVMSGIIGVRKWQYDVWSNDVTIANRMEQTGCAGRVHITSNTRMYLSSSDYKFEESSSHMQDSLLKKERILCFFVVPRKKKSERKETMPSLMMSRPSTSDADDNDLDKYYVSLPQSKNMKTKLENKKHSLTTAVTTKRRRTAPDQSTSIIPFLDIINKSKQLMKREIERMPLTKTRQWHHSKGINPLFLTFSNANWSLKFISQPDPLFKLYLLNAVIIFIVVFAVQEFLLPSGEHCQEQLIGIITLVIFSVLVISTWVSTIHLLIVDPHDDHDIDPKSFPKIIKAFGYFSKLLISNAGIRTLIFMLIITCLFAIPVINLYLCARQLTYITDLHSLEDEGYILCVDPWYFTYSMTLALLAVWGFLRIHFVLKLAIYITVTTIYSIVITRFLNDRDKHVRNNNNDFNYVNSMALDPWQCHIIYMITIVTTIHVIDRQMEYIMRLDFKWKQQLQQEYLETERTHFTNKELLKNILPHHVAEKFLNSTNRDELYHESYNNVAVMFASIPNFSDYYKENEINDGGKKCLKVLNEIISEFDLLTDHEFSSIEKIKIVGSTYMAACGLKYETHKSSGYDDDEDDTMSKERDMEDNIQVLVRYAIAMNEKLKFINDEGFQDFALRIGIDAGRVIAGVVGSQKPMYDIWGDTVNVASRMDYTGEMGKIHVTGKVGQVLLDMGWNVTCRGKIQVKGKKDMITFFVDPNIKPPPILSKGSIISNPISGDVNASARSSISTITKSITGSKKGSMDVTKPNKSRRFSQISGTSVDYSNLSRGSVDSQISIGSWKPRDSSPTGGERRRSSNKSGHKSVLKNIINRRKNNVFINGFVNNAFTESDTADNISIHDIKHSDNNRLTQEKIYTNGDNETISVRQIDYTNTSSDSEEEENTRI